MDKVDQLMAMAEYYNKPISEEQLRIYLIALEDIDEETFERVVAHVLKTSTWFPRINELIKVSALVDRSTGASDPARLYWHCMSEFGRALREHDKNFDRSTEGKWMIRNSILQEYS